MPFISEALDKVREYSDTYRHPDRDPLEISDEYDLFPSIGTDDPACSGWPDTYPKANRQGVYLISDKDRKLLYVGKASLGNTLGARLSSYFSYDADGKSCKIIHKSNWSEDPRFLITVVVPSEAAFEAPSLEEFLITSFRGDLPDNELGTK
jgi:hypothetical protein